MVMNKVGTITTKISSIGFSMTEVVFDIEADNLLPGITKIHCVSYSEVGGKLLGTLYDQKEIEQFFSHDYLYIGHHIVGYDFKALNKIYGIKRPKYFLDTLAWSWYLFPDRAEHGLESWGEDFGVPKPKIDDWQNLTIEEYTHRCEEDVKINTKLYELIKSKMKEIYS